MLKIARVLCLVLIPSAALADDAGPTQVTNLTRWQVFAMAPPAIVEAQSGGFHMPRGLGFTSTSANGVGVTQAGFGINVGGAFALNEMFSVGGALALDIGTTNLGGATGTVYQVVFEPLVKVNLGKTLKWNDHLNPFLMGGIGFGTAGNNFSGGVLFGVEADVGCEYLITPNWSVLAYVPLGLSVVATTPSVVTFGTGLMYGVTLSF